MEAEEEDLKNHYTELQKNNYKKTICLDETGIKLNMQERVMVEVNQEQEQ